MFAVREKKNYIWIGRVFVCICKGKRTILATQAKTGLSFHGRGGSIFRPRMQFMAIGIP